MNEEKTGRSFDELTDEELERLVERGNEILSNESNISDESVKSFWRVLLLGIKIENKV